MTFSGTMIVKGERGGSKHFIPPSRPQGILSKDRSVSDVCEENSGFPQHKFIPNLFYFMTNGNNGAGVFGE
jgi:hypothetical protein